MRRLISSMTLGSSLLLSVSLLVSPAAHAGNRHMRKYQPPPPMGSLTVTVLRASDGKPIQNAAVVFHTQEKSGKDDGNMELKTTKEGTATLNIIPIGSKVLVQVIAPGFRTYGKEYSVPNSTNTATVKLLPPEQQYSVFAKDAPPAKSDLQNNTPKTQMGSAAPADSPLLTPPEKKKD